MANIICNICIYGMVFAGGGLAGTVLLDALVSFIGGYNSREK